MNVRIETTNIRMQSYTGSDITIINEKAWEQKSKSKSCSPNKLRYGVLGRQFYFTDERVFNIMYNVRTKYIMFVLKKSIDLFSTGIGEMYGINP